MNPAKQSELRLTVFLGAVGFLWKAQPEPRGAVQVFVAAIGTLAVMILGHGIGRLVWMPLLKRVGSALTSVILMGAIPLVGVLLVVAGVVGNMPRTVAPVAIGGTFGVLMFGWASAVLTLAHAKRPEPVVSRYGFLARRRLRVQGRGR